MYEAELSSVMDAWDDLDHAAQSVVVAQPSKMTVAAENLDKARLAMRRVLQEFAVNLFKNPAVPASNVPPQT